MCIRDSHRSINRRSWKYDEIDGLLANNDTFNSKIYNQLSKLIEIRKNQSAFHPNATQFTFNLGKNFFGFWRQSHDKRQSIFCVSNVTNVFQYLDLSELNLIASNEWWDLISNEIIIDIKSTITLKAFKVIVDLISIIISLEIKSHHSFDAIRFNSDKSKYWNTLVTLLTQKIDCLLS